ncbi:hypothetical protein LP421_19445 [Rhizobium sp. RCAM05350]|nr:hypothetical protein LP421_19445 [Rhizobium sp. RCAM05350]
MKDCILLGQSDGSVSTNIDAADTARAALPAAGHAHCQGKPVVAALK